MPDIFRTAVDSPIGVLALMADDTKLLSVTIADPVPLEAERRLARYFPGCRIQAGENALLLQARTQLSEYFDGRRRSFTLPLLLCGTAFQQGVWRTIQRIPYGKTATYREVAEEVGTRGYRAVALALKANPLPIVVPCHRVLATGGLGGFSLGEGLPTKRLLLDLEGALY